MVPPRVAQSSGVVPLMQRGQYGRIVNLSRGLSNGRAWARPRIEFQEPR
jgi:hypothetical protein